MCIRDRRYGAPLNADGQRILLWIVGMGKLRGRELNVSSDIDLVYVYEEDGQTSGAQAVTASAAATTGSSKLPGTRVTSAVMPASPSAARAPSTSPSMTTVCQLEATTATRRSSAPRMSMLGAP